MASWHGQIEVPALDVRRLTRVVPMVLDRLRALRFADGLLVDPSSGASLDTLRDTTGTHPAAGTCYSGWYHTVADPGDPDPEPVWRQWDVTVEADDREHTAFAVVDAPGSDDEVRLRVEVPDPTRPTELRFGVVMDTQSSGSMRGDVAVDGTLDWAAIPDGAAVGGTKARAATVSVLHRRFRAGLVADVEPTDGPWRVHAELSVTGRGLYRPLMSVALVVLRHPLTRVLERQLAALPDAVERLEEALGREAGDAELADALVDEWLDHLRPGVSE